MTLKVYNTLTGRKEKFVPQRAGEVRMYVCGVTVYDDCHLGHARCYVAFDVIRRYFNYKGYKVFYVQNITDLDDKIIAKARELQSPQEHKDLKALVNKVAHRYTEEYFKCMDYLKVKRASIYPRATEHIEEMVKLIQGLMVKGYAYQVDGNVFFEVSKFAGYGKLSGRTLKEMEAGARVEVDDRKRDPMDFVLWKEAKPGEPSWESPWGAGRPGWHIECSAMSMKYLGQGFDIHGGGQDLIFPHHENEIAQSEAYTGRPFCKYWVHNGFVTVQGAKMAKSLGNVFALKNLFVEFPDPEVARLFLLSLHYRSPMDFSREKLRQSQRRLSRFYNILDFLLQALDGKLRKGHVDEDSLNDQEKVIYDQIEKTRNQFDKAMDDGFNTAAAIASLNRLVRVINALKDRPKASQNRVLLSRVYETLKGKGAILGFFEEHKWERVIDLPQRDEVKELIAERNRVRANGDWALADRIRSDLRARGIILEDRPGKTTWRKARKFDKD
jgi:cysteinyl-tRNA synthetase